MPVNGMKSFSPMVNEQDILSVLIFCMSLFALLDISNKMFLPGDGAGVGKGRTVAGIIFENYLIGRKRALWFSVSTDLKYDAERDLSDIGAGHIPVYPLNKVCLAVANAKSR